MAEKKNIFSVLTSKFSIKNKNILLVICIVIVCVVVVLFTTNTSTKQKDNQSQQYTFDALSYADSVSKNLEETLSSVKGISNVKVVVVVEQSPQTEYLLEGKSDEQVVSYFKNGSTYEPVVVTQFLPKITGILIVAKGTNDLALKNKLLNAISVVYSVNISCIDILEGK